MLDCVNFNNFMICAKANWRNALLNLSNLPKSDRIAYSEKLNYFKFSLMIKVSHVRYTIFLSD